MEGKFAQELAASQTLLRNDFKKIVDEAITLATSTEGGVVQGVLFA